MRYNSRDGPIHMQQKARDMTTNHRKANSADLVRFDLCSASWWPSWWPPSRVSPNTNPVEHNRPKLSGTKTQRLRPLKKAALQNSFQPDHSRKSYCAVCGLKFAATRERLSSIIFSPEHSSQVRSSIKEAQHIDKGCRRLYSTKTPSNHTSG